MHTLRLWSPEPAGNVLSRNPQQAGAFLHPERPHLAFGAQEPLTPSPGLGLMRVGMEGGT